MHHESGENWGILEGSHSSLQYPHTNTPQETVKTVNTLHHLIRIHKQKDSTHTLTHRLNTPGVFSGVSGTSYKIYL